LEDSRNVPTIKLMDQLGRTPVIDMARKFGITAPLQPYLSAAIGAEEVTLMEMTSAYTAFPNQGVRMDPILALEVTDREGNVLESATPRAHEVIKADTAFIMTSILEGVLKEGTGVSKAAMAEAWPLAGKTGTTDDVTDVWFVGFDPEITIGVWVGFDQKKTIGERQEGAKAALPIWADVMQTWIDRQKKILTAKPKFEMPGNIVYVMLDTGKAEVFIAGTEPGGRR
jgi:penicillin-binding protein 1A